MAGIGNMESSDTVRAEDGAMELDCLKGDWGLPSVDIKCLNVLTYGQFAGASLKVNKNRTLWRNPSAHFPIFRAAQEVIRSDTQVIRYFQENQLDLDEELTDQQRADVLAFKALMEEKFLPGMLHVWWIDAKNYVEFTRPWYAKALNFPFNYFIPGRWHREAESRVEVTRGGNHMEPQEVTNRVYNDAKECMNLLSVRLGEEDFFLAKYTKQPTSKTPMEDPFDDPHKRRNQVLAVLFALAAMVSYAFLNGLVRLQITDSEGGIELEYDDGDEGQ